MSQGSSSRKPAHTPAGAAVTDLVIELFRLNGRLLAAGDRLVDPIGLTSARWQVLGAVAMASAPETVAQLARDMGAHRQGVQRLVDVLEAEGWLAFAPNPQHRRAKLVELTPAGAMLYEKAAGLQVPWANELAAEVDVAALESAVRVMSGLRARLEAAGSLPAEEAPDEGNQRTRSRLKTGGRRGR